MDPSKFVNSTITGITSSVEEGLSSTLKAVTGGSPLDVSNTAIDNLAPETKLPVATHTDHEGTTTYVGSHNAVTTTSEPAVEGVAESYATHSTDDFYSCAYEFGAEEGNIQKLAYFGSSTYTTSDNTGHMVATFGLPELLVNYRHQPAAGQCAYFQFGRAALEFRVQCSAPFGYGGLLVMFYAPPDYCNLFTEGNYFDSNGPNFGCILNLPYVLFDISKQTEATLSVPYINHVNYADLHLPGTMGKICVAAFTPLLAPTGQTNSVSVSIFGAFVDLDLQCPRHPQLPSQGRRRLKRVQGPKPPPTSMVPQHTMIAPGPGSWNAANSVMTTDAESLAVGNDAASVDFATVGANCCERDLCDILRRWTYCGKTMWASNTNPGTSTGHLSIDFQHGNWEYFSRTFHYWRGTLELKAVVVTPRTAQGKLAISWYPTGVGAQTQFSNSIYVLQDATGSTPVLRMPFTSATWRRNWDNYGTVTAVVVNAYRSQPNTAPQATILWFMRAGEDFELFSPLRPTKAMEDKFFPPLRAPSFKNQGNDNLLSTEEEPTAFLNFEVANVQIQSRRHSEIKNFFGRAIYYGEFGPNSQAQKIPLSPKADDHLSLAMFYGYFSGEVLVTTVTGRDSAIVGFSYDYHPTDVPLQELMGMGAAFIPPRCAKTYVCPFYSRDPLRSLYHPIPSDFASVDGTFGNFFLSSSQLCYVYVSFRNPNFFFKLAPPKYKAQRSMQIDQLLKELAWEDHEDHDDILLGGDIEENPGPQLVTKDRGLYKHYGVLHNGYVFEVASENIAQAVLDGMVGIKHSPVTADWKPVGPNVRTMAEKYLEAGVFPKLKFSWHTNCESWAKSIVLGEPNSEQGKNFIVTLTMAAGLMLFFSLEMVDQAGIAGSITRFVAKLTNLICGGFESYVVRIVVKTLCRIICYLILYSHSPNLLTTGVLAALIYLDCSNNEVDKQFQKLVEALVEGKFTVFCKYLAKEANVEIEVEAEDGEPLHSQGPKPFNEWTAAAKNVQWWFEKLQKAVEWVKNKLFPPDLGEAIDFLEEKKDQFAILFATVDQHICLMHTDKTYSVAQSTREKHVQLCDDMSSAVEFLTNLPKASALVTRACALQARLTSINFEPAMNWHARPEPVGVWITGLAGAGKSFLVNKIATSLAKHFGWTVYANPTGSNHMDGYTSQEIHVFDDFGQNREEEDYSLICQLISSVPYIVPKAEVTAKGTPYNARVVLVTTNRSDFSSTKLFDTEALKRRFPFLLKVRPRQECSTEDRLDLSLAFNKGYLANGTCWQRDLAANKSSVMPQWMNLDVEELVKDLIAEIETRQKIVNLVNQGGQGVDKVKSKIQKLFQKRYLVDPEEPKTFFDCERLGKTVKLAINPPKTGLDKCKLFFKELVGDLKKFLEKHRMWIMAIGAISSIISLSLAFMPWKKTLDQSLYDGSGPQRLTRDFKRVAEQHVKMQPQGPQDMVNQGKLNFEPIKQRMANVWDGRTKATALHFGNKEVITYGHDSFTHVVDDSGDYYPIKQCLDMTIGGQTMDLQVCVVETPRQFKDLTKFVLEEDYRGNGFLMWKEGSDYTVQCVKNIRPYTGLRTTMGSLSTFAYIYDVSTTVGSCGGVLLGVVGGNLKILGIHTAGNGVTGAANRLFQFEHQGVARVLTTYPKPLYHQPRRTKFFHSPLFESPSVEPAVLSKHDPRLEVEVDDVTKKAAQKYVGNVFNPPGACFMAAVSIVAHELRAVVSKSDCITYEEATSNFLPMDWSTSPGLKYQGRSKRSLVGDPKFRADVEWQLEEPGTIFTTYLKDELRPVEKIKLGKTRAIEACNFDYTVAYRMVMGGIYNQIYEDREAVSGVAVGICPYLHFGGMLSRLYDHCICMDFSGFDGSLPPELLEAAVEILASCHVNPDLVKKIHKPVIYSHQLVSDQLWAVDGGMCSGAPCTSVLNSIANNIAAYTVMLSCGAPFEGFKAVSYGDDIVFSSSKQFDLANVAPYYKMFFGMTCTGADKSAMIEWMHKSEIVFLKRKPGRVDFFPMEVGVLDLTSMLDKIQWTKGFFDQQLDSFAMELVLHGPDVYAKIQQHAEKVCPGIRFPSYLEMSSKMKSLMFDQGKPTGPESQILSGNHRMSDQLFLTSAVQNLDLMPSLADTVAYKLYEDHIMAENKDVHDVEEMVELLDEMIPPGSVAHKISQRFSQQLSWVHNAQQCMPEVQARIKAEAKFNQRLADQERRERNYQRAQLEAGVPRSELWLLDQYSEDDLLPLENQGKQGVFGLEAFDRAMCEIHVTNLSDFVALELYRHKLVKHYLETCTEEADLKPSPIRPTEDIADLWLESAFLADALMKRQ